MAEGDEGDDSQRTEDATPKKLEEARKRGQVPMSKETNTWLMLLISTIVVAAIVPGMIVRITELLTVIMEQSWQMVGVPGLSRALMRIVMDIFIIIAAPLAILFVAAMLGPFAQVGPLFSTEVISLKLDKVSPIQGFKRLFSKKSLFEFVKGVVKVVIIGVVSIYALRPYLDGIEHLIDLPIPQLMEEMLEMFVQLMISILSILFLLAGADLLFQRYTHMMQMRMSRQEIRDEYKQTEGDPHVRSRLRQLRMERARGRMMQNVPTSTVVITNPTHFAVALKYEPDEMEAPVCVAKGQDLIALRIRQVAEENGVIIVENPPLARTLFKVMEIDDVIPSEHYKAVAEVISYVFRMKKKL